MEVTNYSSSGQHEYTRRCVRRDDEPVGFVGKRNKKEFQIVSIALPGQ